VGKFVDVHFGDFLVWQSW